MSKATPSVRLAVSERDLGSIESGFDIGFWLIRIRDFDYRK